MKHIEEIQIAGTALLLCGAMFAVSAVAPKGESISKAVTNFTRSSGNCCRGSGTGRSRR